MTLWDNRCKVALSGVGYSKATRLADRPLAAHALEAVKAAVADSGLKIEDIDGLTTYPELPATGHAEVDGISIVSVNCMMAMLKLPNLQPNPKKIPNLHQYPKKFLNSKRNPNLLSRLQLLHQPSQKQLNPPQLKQKK